MKCRNCGSIVPDDLTICSVCKKPTAGVVRTSPGDAGTVMCPCCGESNFIGIEICAKCGSPLPAKKRSSTQGAAASRTAAKNKTRINPKFVVAVAAIFLLLVAAVVAVIFAVRSSRDTEVPSGIKNFYSKRDDSTSFISGGKELLSFNGHTKAVCTSADGSVLAVLEPSGVLSCVSENGAVKVAENVLECRISDSGKTIAYILNEVIAESDTQSESESTEKDDSADTSETQTTSQNDILALNKMSNTSLFLYDCEQNTSGHISNNVTASSVVLSPGGKTVAYTMGTADSSGFECYVCNNGIYTSLGKSITVVAVADDLAHCYYLKHESYNGSYAIKLFAKNKTKTDDIKLGEFADISELRCFLNKSYSQIVFSLNGADGNFFISSDCSEKKRLSPGFSCKYVGNVAEKSNLYTTVCPVESFDGAVFTDIENTAFYLDSTLSPTVISEDTASVRVSADSVFYVDQNEYLYSCTFKNLADKKKLATHVKSFSVSDDGKLWYTNSDNELHCIVSGDDNIVSSKVYTPSSGLSVSGNGTLYFLEDYSFGSGSLCYCENGKDKKTVDGADNVYDIITDGSENVYYRSDYSGVSGTFDLFFGRKNAFEKISDADNSATEVTTNA